MSETTDALFRFRIGQEVTHRSMLTPFQGRSVTPQKFRVLARWLEECPGGVQLHYDVRILGAGLHSAGIVDRSFRFHEDELVEYAG